jgi:GNAT superfamily N-acetyltransferase
MAGARTWRPREQFSGPHPVRLDDVAPLNVVFSDAFTERYRRDGMVGVRVPMLNPAIWRYAIEDAAEGALLWRDGRGQIAAFNIVHRSGAEGWMGPLAVRPEYQGSGFGKTVVTTGVAWLRAQGARVIGLETMPRTMDNIGFYSALGFMPGRLTLTVTLDAAPAARAPLLLGRASDLEKASLLDECRAMLQRLAAGYDYTREIAITDRLALGDTLLLRDDDGALRGFALCHSAPLVEGRAREELRVLKLALDDETLLDPMLRGLRDLARRSGTRRVALRMQGDYPEAYASLIRQGGKVRWSDLRMSLGDAPEQKPVRGVVLSNWEI